MNDKKKIIIVVALGVLMLSIGAFQFTKLSAGEAQAPASEESQVVSDKEPTRVASNHGANDLVTGSYPERDPFKPGEMPEPLFPTIPGGQQNSQPQNNTLPNTQPGPRMPPLDGNLNIQPFPVNPTGDPSLPTFQPGVPYTLSGIIIGEKPAAVFVDAQGVQRLVQLGGSLDGDTVVSKIERREVTLRINDKNHTLTLGGDPSEE